MEKHLYSKEIQQYYKAMRDIHLSGETKETSTRDAFHDLVKKILPAYYKVLLEQTSKGDMDNNTIYYDLIFTHKGGALIGVLEDKGPKADLKKEIEHKYNKGYNFRNILFQNTEMAMLIQNGEKDNPYCANIANKEEFSKILNRWVSYSNEETRQFEKAYDRFVASIPTLAKEISSLIEVEYEKGGEFTKDINSFYESLRATIGETVTLQDVQEIIMQHIMTRDLFETILASSFNKFNSISKLIETIISSLGRGFEEKIRNDITPYYESLAESLRNMHDLHYEVEVLRTFYEEFYKAYNPKKADTLGIVYTPIEVVNFMVAMSDHLLGEHFGKHLASPGVRILDPCTGTGTFIASLLHYLPLGDLPHKYASDLHANEVSILSYYIGNLYIERVHQSLSPDNLFSEFENMCLVDTLDNVYASSIKKKLDEDAFEEFGISAIDEENTKKVQKQNTQDLLVIIGNPPYNANQQNANQNNQNKAYTHIDKRIKETYVKKSSSQNLNKVYDMYTRFIRWATDRIGDEGMVAFVTNRSFLDAKGFDGFRASIKDEFTYVYSLDLGGDVRKNPRLSGHKNNVFAIQTGVTITFFIKVKKPKTPPGIFYANPFDVLETRQNKLNYLQEMGKNYSKIKSIPWQTITPTAQNQWLNISTSDFMTLPIELANKTNKAATAHDFQTNGKTLFGLYSLGVVTSRDSWVYDKNEENLERKVKYFIGAYNEEVERWQKSDQSALINNFVKRNIKWTSELENYLKKATAIENVRIVTSLYRPFQRANLAYDKVLIHRLHQMPHLFPTGQPGENLLICFSSSGTQFEAIMSNIIVDLNLLTSGAGPTQCLSLYRYNGEGQRQSNIHVKMLQGWAAELGFTPTPEQAFYYVYALLNHQGYRKKYEKDLIHNFPRVPLLAHSFTELAKLGEQLGHCHIHFSDAAPYEDCKVETATHKPSPLPKLRSDKAKGIIFIDDNTQITNVPEKAWDYRLGSRSAIDWVLEGYKEKKISLDDGDVADPTSPLYTEFHYQAYRFSEYKQECIDLLQKVIQVSLETQNLVAQISQYPL